MKKVFKNTIFLSVCGLLTVVVAWVIACLIVQNEYALPSPWATATAAVGLLGQSGFYVALFSTLGRAALAFVAAFVFGVGLAVIAYLHPSFEKFYGKRADKVRKLYNGMIPCYLYQFFKK